MPETEFMPKYENPFSYILRKGFILTDHYNDVSVEAAGGVYVHESDYNTRYGVWIVSSQTPKAEASTGNLLTRRHNRVVVGSEANFIG